MTAQASPTDRLIERETDMILRINAYIDDDGREELTFSEGWRRLTVHPPGETFDTYKSTKGAILMEVGEILGSVMDDLKVATDADPGLWCRLVSGYRQGDFTVLQVTGPSCCYLVSEATESAGKFIEKLWDWHVFEGKPVRG